MVILGSKAIESNKIEKVMKSVDRGDFTKSDPDEDSPQYIGYGVTISAPHMVIAQFMKNCSILI